MILVFVPKDVRAVIYGYVLAIEEGDFLTHKEGMVKSLEMIRTFGGDYPRYYDTDIYKNGLWAFSDQCKRLGCITHYDQMFVFYDAFQKFHGMDKRHDPIKTVCRVIFFKDYRIEYHFRHSPDGLSFANLISMKMDTWSWVEIVNFCHRARDTIASHEVTGNW